MTPVVRNQEGEGDRGHYDLALCKRECGPIFMPGSGFANQELELRYSLDVESYGALDMYKYFSGSDFWRSSGSKRLWA